MANTVPLYYQTLVERQAFGVRVPAAALQSISPIFTVALLPLLSARWARQARSGTEQSAATKLAIGAALQGCAWLLFAATAVRCAPDAKGSLGWPILANLLYTVGHMHIGPVGLSLATRCAPPGSQSSAVGIWFLFGGLAGPLAGSLGAFYSLWTPSSFFAALGALALSDALVVLALVPRLERTARAHDLE